MAAITPFVKRMRTQGGTLYTFSSANEDIGLNINERNTDVKMSHYALLDIPAIQVPSMPDASTSNKFNVFAIPGALQSWLDSGSIKDGRIMVAESFQNYALNLEANLLNRDEYNANLLTSVTERVFWKWLKETGAVRWTYDSSNYWKEEIDTDSSVGYNSVVKCVGQISAGSVRSDSYGTFQETYVLIPTSYGQSDVWFKEVRDVNYDYGITIPSGDPMILGRESYTRPHPDALDFKAYYDVQDSSNKITTALGDVNMTCDGVSGWWPSAEGIAFNTNSYYTDKTRPAVTGPFNKTLTYSGAQTASFLRSSVDCMSIELDMQNLRNHLGDQTLTFDKLATPASGTSTYGSIDDQFYFNAVLLYYSVWNKTSDKLLATNLYGILFLDAPSGNTQQYSADIPIIIPALTKRQSGPSGFGTSYSFRTNIKSDSMMDDTQATIYDESTSAQTALENFSNVFTSLEKSVSILNQHTGTINFIAGQYLDITSTQTDTLNQVKDIQQQINSMGGNIVGTPNVIPMYTSGDDPLGDSSIYMKNGKIGFFTPDPVYPARFDVSVKVKDLTIENAIRDTSGNILLGYGSPLQIGSSTGAREISFYAGKGTPSFRVDLSNNITFLGNVTFDGSVLDASGGTIGGGVGDVTKLYVDGSLDLRDVSIANIVTKLGHIDTSLNNLGIKDAAQDTSINGIWAKFAQTDASILEIRATYIPDTSLGTSFIWTNGVLDASTSGGGGGDVTKLYVDGSLVIRDTSIAWLNSYRVVQDTSIANAVTKFGHVDTSLNNLGIKDAAQDTTISNLTTRVNTTDTSLNTLTTRVNTTDTSLNTLRNRHNITETSLGYADASIKSLDSVKHNKDATSLGIGTSWDIDVSGTMIRFRYNGVDRMIFTADGSILARGGVTALAEI